jgi:ribosomal protein S18 acetylase RimI-like enzyme
MRVRTFRLDNDYEAVTALWDMAEWLSTPPRDEVVAKLERDADLFLVAQDGDDLVGVVMGSYDGRRGWIFRLAVDPGRRRQGIGEALVAELERRCAERGIRHLRLLVLADNEGGIRFWDSLGYRRFDEVVLFSKDLGGREASDC